MDLMSTFFGPPSGAVPLAIFFTLGTLAGVRVRLVQAKTAAVGWSTVQRGNEGSSMSD